MYVVRRKAARHDGTRYYNDKGPPCDKTDEGAVFDGPESADAARQKLREPHLWEVLTQAEATKRDAADRRAESRHRMDPMTASVLAFAAATGVRLPRRRPVGETHSGHLAWRELVEVLGCDPCDDHAQSAALANARSAASSLAGAGKAWDIFFRMATPEQQRTILAEVYPHLGRGE